jgi:hypothetical protein
MKGLWIDAGNDPHWERLEKHQINRVYFPVSDPVADVQRRLADARGRGYVVGLYSAWNWTGYTGSGADYARATHERVKLIAPTAKPSDPKIMLDDETHDPDRIIQMLNEWRRLRPTTDTAWTLESFQGGWFAPGLVEALVARKVRVVPQCYWGNMVQVCTLTAARDLTKRGVPDSLITPFYDAADLPVGWDGFAFTMGRLPWP